MYIIILIVIKCYMKGVLEVESKKVLNIYKVIAILSAYKSCIRNRSAVDLEKVMQDIIIRKPVLDKIIKATKFEDIDAIELKNLQVNLERYSCKNLDECQEFLLSIYDHISDKDRKLLKRLGLDIEKVVKVEVSEVPKVPEVPEDPLERFRKIGEDMDDWDYEDDIISDDEDTKKAVRKRDRLLKEALKKFFIDEKFYFNFLEDIEFELKRREKELNRIGVKTGTQADDTVLTALRNREVEREKFRDREVEKEFSDGYAKTGEIKGKEEKKKFLEKIQQEAEECKNFNELERLLLMYTTGRGCDYMNGFLRGDMSAIKAVVKPIDEFEEEEKKKELKPNLKNSSWDTDLNVDFNLLLDTALNAFRLRKGLTKGTLDHVTEVYKGISLDRMKRALGLKDSDTMDDVIDYINRKKPVYKTREFTSTSTYYEVAKLNAFRLKNVGKSVIMNIKLNRGTVFGKDLSKTGFGKRSDTTEVVLMSNQKIKLNSAKKKEKLMEIECETIR